MTQADTTTAQGDADENARMCYFIPDDAYVEGRGYRAAIVTEGEPGYRLTGTWPNDGTGVMPYFWGHDLEKAQVIAAEQNAALGLSKRDVNVIILSSMGAQ